MKRKTIKALTICLMCLIFACTQVQAKNQWTPQMEAEFQQRSKYIITKLAGREYGSTAQESEKKSYPRATLQEAQSFTDHLALRVVHAGFKLGLDKRFQLRRQGDIHILLFL